VKRFRLVKVLSLVATLALVAAACGDDDDDSAPSTETTTETSATTGGGEASTTVADGTTESTEAPAPGESDPTATPVEMPAFEGEASTRGITDDTIKIGGVAQLDFFPGMEEGARARFERANREGGIHGRQIEFLGVENDGSDAAKNLDIIRAQVENEEVFAMIATSPTLLPASTDYMAENHVPFYGWGFMPGFCHPNYWGFGFNGCLSPGPFGVPDAPGNLSLIEPVAELVGKPLEELRLVVLNSDDDAGRGGSAGYQALFGDQIVAEDFVPTVTAGGVTDPTTWVNLVNENDPDAVILSTDFGAAVVLKAAILASGYDGPLIDYTTYQPGLLESQPNVAQGLEGGYTNSQIPPIEDGTAGPAQIITDLEAIGETPFAASGTSIGYWSADLLVQQLELVGPELNTQTFYDTINLCGFLYASPEGGIGPIGYPIGHFEMQPCAGLVRVVDGVYTSAVPFKCYGLVDLEA
jgi:branched-chain amino acid transport system substrate-binding protein